MEFSDDIRQALDVLNSGGVILYPTDTIWGIGCDATNEKAVQRVYEIKKKTVQNGLIILVHTDALISSYIDEMPDMAYDLIDFATKPLTLILDGAKNLPQNLTADDRSVGIRVSNEKFSHELVKRFKRPIVSTSANVSGQASPANFAAISDEIKQAVDYIVHFRRDETIKHTASSLMKLSVNGMFKVIRE